MHQWLQTSVQWLLHTLALPEVGLSAIFVVSMVSATLLPMGSEPAVFGYVKLAPHMFWAAVLMATAGNTLGGVISYWMGALAKRAVERIKAHREARLEHEHGHEHEAAHESGHGDDRAPSRKDRWHATAHAWVERFGAKTLLLSWVPLVGDPLCAVAGWLRLDFRACVVYMAIGKLGRYLTMTAALLWMFPDK
ncbi:Inner membrane protein YqaA [Pigmentiphaga humi]|uniref:Inner membrane protein YqaA n=1 Tax=Pigmentiphaga humi TaxID=2478468 RepID=A0A3P4AVE2_9BURK|nr:YqaA family protein [Pigmentiphaga humi]VCU67987.1 Inner membrane protein YqaA [Pigmentiphaga humi]